MNRSLTDSLLILLVVFLTIGAIKIPLPFLTDIRKMIVFPLFFGLVSLFFTPKSRIKLLDLAQSPTGMALLIFALIIVIASTVNLPSDGFKSIFSYLFGVLGFFFGYATLSTVDKPEKLLKIIIIAVISTSMFAAINSVLVLITGKPFIVFSNAFTTDKITEYRLYDYARGRIYPLSYIELTVPFVAFMFLLRPQTIIKKLGVVFILILEMLAIFLSNYRGIALGGVMGTALIFIFTKAPAKMFLTVILTPLLIGLFFQAKTGSIIDRLLFKNQEDITTVAARIEASFRAFDIGMNNPVFGVGLGNFINYAEWVWTSGDRSNIIAYQNPHNAYLMLFAETGLPSVTIYIILIVKMLKTDLNFLVKRNSDSNNIILPFIVSSWIFMAINLIEWYPTNYTVYFFLIRGVLHGWYRL